MGRRTRKPGAAPDPAGYPSTAPRNAAGAPSRLPVAGVATQATPAPSAESQAGRHRRFARGRLAAVSVGAAMAAGAWVGLATGLLLGSALGAALAWFAGAILGWQQDLGLTLGIVRNLLPFGDQAPLLRSLSNYWYLVIPATAFVSGLVGAMVAGLIGGLIAAAYNRSPRHATVLVELPPVPEFDETRHAAAPNGTERPDDGDARHGPKPQPG